MATKPIIKPITPFDVADGVRITAQYSGNMPYHNRVVIQDAITMVTVYARTIASSEYAHFVDPEYAGSAVVAGDVGYSLINGRRYTATIQFFGRSITTDVGLVSDKTAFLTRKTPIFYLDGITDGDVIEAASIQLNLIYSQNEGEKLLNYRFYIYNNNKSLLQETEIMYDTTNTSYTFKGLENETVYYVRATGMTVNGISMDTGYIQIMVKYQNPSVYQRMYVECNENTSEMNYYTNFIMIESEEDPDSFKYEDGYIYLDEGQTVTYSEGFEIEGDATWHIRAKDMDYEQVIMRCMNKNNQFYVEGIRDTDMTLRFRLVVPNALGDYILYTQSVNIDWTDVVNIWIRRINNIYDIKLFIEKNPVVIGALYLENYEPNNPYEADQDVWINMDEVPGVEVRSYDVRIFYQATEPSAAVDYNIWIE